MIRTDPAVIPKSWSDTRRCKAVLHINENAADRACFLIVRIRSEWPTILPTTGVVRTVRDRAMRLILPVTAQSGEPVPKGVICRGTRRWLL